MRTLANRCSALTLLALVACSGVPEASSVAPDVSEIRAASRIPSSPYAPPLAAPLVLERTFERPASSYGPGHRGVDLRATAGTEVLAPAAGTVSFVGQVAGRPVLTLRHPDGLRSSLEPVEPMVREGETVLAGEPVGTLAGTIGHCAPSSCLHWGVREPDGSYVDPLRLLRGGPTVLLPGP